MSEEAKLRLAATSLRLLVGDLVAALERARPLAESWADGVGSSHPDHEVIKEVDGVLALARRVLDDTKGAL